MYKIGIDLGGTKTAAGIISLENKIISKTECPTASDSSADEIAADICDLIFELLDNAALSLEDISQIGIGIPGSVSNGVIMDINNLPLTGTRFSELIWNQLFSIYGERTPNITLINDARAAALAEYYEGSAKDISSKPGTSFYMITLGTGVGGSFIYNGTVLTGCNNSASEPGHMVLVHNGRPCTCGRKGCFEQYASASSFIRDCIATLPSTSALYSRCNGDVSLINGVMIFDCIRSNDPYTCDQFELYTDLLSQGLANIINLLQPDILSIGGGISGAGDILLTKVRTKTYKLVYSQSCFKQTDIRLATLKNDAGIIGAVLGSDYVTGLSK